MKKLYPFLTIIIIGTFIGIIIGMKFFCAQCDDDKEQTIITSQTVLDKISDKSFLITKSVLLDQETVKTNESDWWHDLWLKDEIKAQALVSVDVGIDLSKLDNEDIIIDIDNKTITIDLPEAEITEASLSGDIKLETESGIVTAFTRDKNDDYNDAIDQLKKDSQKAVEEQKNILENARENGIELLSFILTDLDYSVKLADPE